MISLFEDVTVHFTPDDSTLYDSPFASARDKGRIMATYREMTGSPGPGRVLLNLEVRPIRQDIRNMVDRWDRAGWIRLVKPGMAPVEMARFMTAYGGAISHEVDITRLAPLADRALRVRGLHRHLGVAGLEGGCGAGVCSGRRGRS